MEDWSFKTVNAFFYRYIFILHENNLWKTSKKIYCAEFSLEIRYVCNVIFLEFLKTSF